MKDCEGLKYYLTDAMESDAKKRFEAHLTDCEKCSDVVKEDRTISRALFQVPKVNTPTRFVATVMGPVWYCRCAGSRYGRRTSRWQRAGCGRAGHCRGSLSGRFRVVYLHCRAQHFLCALRCLAFGAVGSSNCGERIPGTLLCLL